MERAGKIDDMNLPILIDEDVVPAPEIQVRDPLAVDFVNEPFQFTQNLFHDLLFMVLVLVDGTAGDVSHGERLPVLGAQETGDASHLLKDAVYPCLPDNMEPAKHPAQPAALAVILYHNEAAVTGNQEEIGLDSLSFDKISGGLGVDWIGTHAGYESPP